MDYEKKYNEALEKAKFYYDSWPLEEEKNKLENMFPELRESEDERMLKKIIEYLEMIKMGCVICTIDTSEEIAWLKKQKINTEGDFGRGYDCGYQAGYAVAMNKMKPKVATATLDSEKQKEQKPELVQHPPITFTYNSNASRDERLKAALLALLNSDLLKVKEGGYFTKQDLIEWVERIPTDKPSWSEEDEEVMEDLYNFVTSDFIQDHIHEARWKPWKTTLERNRQNRLKSIRFQPKQEWSEKDSEAIDSLIGFVTDYGDNCYTSIAKADLLSWLEKWKSANKNASFANKSANGEWSEEDEKMRINILNALTPQLVYSVGKGTYTGTSTYKYDDEIRWLKSLRPQPKQEWSEEDGKRYISIGTTLETSVLLSKEDYDANMAWLRELVNAKKYSSPRPSWKPSEEQMEALQAVIDSPTQYQCIVNELKPLYDELKKL